MVFFSPVDSTLAGDDKRVFNVLLPALIPGGSVSVEASDTESLKTVLQSVTFCIVFDATGSMEPIAEQVASNILSALKSLPAQTFSDARMGFVFFRDKKDSEPKKIVEPTDLTRAGEFLRSYASNMRGGDDDAEPILDALYLATHLFEWGGGGRQGSRRVVLAVLNADAHPHTQAGIDERVPAGLSPRDIGNEMAEKRTTVITVQAGKGAGAHLRPVLEEVAALTNGSFVSWSDTDLGATIGARIRAVLTDIAVATREEGQLAVSKGSVVGDKYVVPLEALDASKLEQLREAGLRFNIDAGGGILVREGYIPENETTLSHNIRIEKETLERLLRLFRALTVTTISGAEMRRTFAENIAAIAGEDYDPAEKISDVFKRRFGIQFRTRLLSLDVDELIGMTDDERDAWNGRIKKASDKLANFLEAHISDFDRDGTVWMKVANLP